MSRNLNVSQWLARGRIRQCRDQQMLVQIDLDLGWLTKIVDFLEKKPIVFHCLWFFYPLAHKLLLMWKRYLCTLLYLVIISARELLSRSDNVSFSSGTLRRQDECSTWTWTVTSASSATILILVSWRKVFIWAVFIAHQRGFISWNTVI